MKWPGQLQPAFRHYPAAELPCSQVGVPRCAISIVMSRLTGWFRCCRGSIRLFGAIRQPTGKARVQSTGVAAAGSEDCLGAEAPKRSRAEASLPHFQHPAYLGFPVVIPLLVAIAPARFSQVRGGSLVGDAKSGREGRSWNCCQAKRELLLTAGFVQIEGCLQNFSARYCSSLFAVLCALCDLCGYPAFDRACVSTVRSPDLDAL